MNPDVVIASLPYIETDEPMMAPGLLKGIVKKVGLSCYTFDFNIEVIHKLKRDYSKEVEHKVIQWFLYKEYEDDPEVNAAIEDLVKYVANRIAEKNATWICLSLFCHTAKKFNQYLCEVLRSVCPTAKIVIGGNAVFSDEKSKRPYALILKKAKLIDHYIIGDGEEPFYNLLSGNDMTGVDQDKFQVLNDLSKQPFADYDDYNWDLYPVKRIPMYGSRGCVRKCTFCDIHKMWKKFKLRTAEDVWEEMQYQIQHTGQTSFYFRDSLINGSISEYRKLMTLMADYNSKHEQKLEFQAFFIFRPKEQMTEEDWRLTGAAGAKNLYVGVESLADPVRHHMKKHFSNEDMDFALACAKKYQVGLTYLLIIGYVNETEKDFQDSLKWLEDHVEYAHMPIINLTAGGTLTVTDLTDLYQNAESYGITLGDKIHLWENKSINLDYQTRERRKEIFVQKAIDLGYPVLYFDKPVAN